MTKDEPIKAAGYVRVSSKDQVGNESLSTQRESIKNYCKSQGMKLINIYADEGISGGTVEERHALLQCLYDGQNGKFNVLVIHRLSRFGRNARELLDNHDALSKIDIQLRSISEGIDFSSKYGKAVLGILAVVAELEKDIIRETMLENRIARGRKGIPTGGSLPFGRTFDKETGQWDLDKEAARLLQWAADEYLNGGSLMEISHTLKTRYNRPLSYPQLINNLANRSGDTWSVNFQGEAPITYKIPRILDEITIQRIKERLEHNRTEKRKDVKKYVLNGFIRCEVCGKSLSGQTQNQHNRHYPYYYHPTGKYEKCKAFNSIPLKQIEKAVFQTIFENIVDVPSFEKAIAESLPDEKLINSIKSKIQAGEKELKRIGKELEKLVEAVLSKTLKKETIKEKENSFLEAKAKATEELESNRDRLQSLPDVQQVKEEAEQIRRQLLDRFSGKGRLKEMTFDEKKTLLHWLFDGKDSKGTRYGIYINKKKKGQGREIDYFLYGRITGLRTLKDDNINYQDGDEDETEYNSNKGGFNLLNP